MQHFTLQCSAPRHNRVLGFKAYGIIILDLFLRTAIDSILQLYDVEVLISRELAFSFVVKLSATACNLVDQSLFFFITFVQS